MSHCFTVSDVEKFHFYNWPVELHRKPFRRSVSVSLYPNRAIKVLAPKLLPNKAVMGFLLERKDWIEKNMQKFQDLHGKHINKALKNNEHFPMRGSELKFRAVITLNKRAFVSATETEILYHIPRNDWSAEVLYQEHPAALKELRNFYKREAIRYLNLRMEHWSSELNLKPLQVKFREQKSRWGSCSSRGIINLNWRLICFSEPVIDYVIVHELSHMRHMNHSKSFWSEVEKYIPDYKIQVKELKEKQLLCEFLSGKF
jgi:predicted metal-dependent hydrolase